MRHQKILVLGGTGFIGGHVVAALAADGRQVVVPARRRESGKRLLTLPTVEVVQADIADDAALGRLVSGRDAVVNLVGILHSDVGTPWGRAFEALHVRLPTRVAAACRSSGVGRLLHMSALGASATGPSMYLRSKAAGEAAVSGRVPGDAAADDGEAAVHDALATTIFRPSVVFGPEDRFLNLFASLQRWLPVLALGRTDARFEPVSVRDVAAAFATAVDDPKTFGRTYELTGPRVYTLGDLVRIAGALRAGGDGRPRPIVRLPDVLGRLQARLLEFAPGKPMSRDNFDSMSVPNVATGRFPGLADLGIVPSPLEPEASHYLARKSRRSHLDHLRRDAHP